MSAVFLAPDQAVRMDWAGLEAYLGRHGFRLDDRDQIRQFAGGLGNLNYLLRINGEACVLRRPPLGLIPVGANGMAREYRILRGLWRSFPHVPHAFHFCGDPGVIGAPFLLMENREGLVIGGRLPAAPRIDPMQRRQISERLVDLLVQLHQVDPAAVGLSDLGRPAGMLARTVDGWHQRAVQANDGACPERATELCSWLRERIPPSQRVSLLHSDYKLDNVIWDADSLAPRAVIDWDMGTRGDPLLDLATLLSYWSEPGDPDVMHRLGQMPTQEAGFLTRDEVMHRYASRTGLDLSDFAFYRVLALFKLAVVFMQLHAKFRRGEVSQERYRGFGNLATGLLEFASEVASATKHQQGR